MSYAYNDRFFDYIDAGARRSAQVMIGRALRWMRPASVADFGCGRGVWVGEWAASGVSDVTGIDGDYVDREKLAIASERFVAADLTRPVDLGRRFDLVQSLEVAEHLPPEAAETFIDTLCRHGEIVLFSAAAPGQGGENHLNERLAEYWRGLFAARGYRAFDAVRPVLRALRDVEPWYRYNTILYATPEAVRALPAEVRAAEVPKDRPIVPGGNAAWRVRLAILRRLPRPLVTGLARIWSRLAPALTPRGRTSSVAGRPE